VKSGGGTQVLAGVNTYTGGTTVEAGTLEIASASALPAGYALSIGETGTVVLSSGLSVPGAGSLATVAVPEPSTLALLGIGAIALLAYGWRRWKLA
jgi:fibronectin-binding autotransporter adhesin